MIFPVERVIWRCDDAPVVNISEGKQIALRREHLNLTQDELAAAAGVSRSTVWKVEKEKNVEKSSYDAVLAALSAAERNLTGSVMPTASTESTKEGVDAAAQLHAAKADLVRLNATLAEAAKDIRRALDTLDALAATATRKHA